MMESLTNGGHETMPAFTTHTINLQSKAQRLIVRHGTALTALPEYFSFGCQAGACGICIIKIHAGFAALNAMHNQEAEFLEELGYSPTSHRLACQCKVYGDVSLEVLTP